MSRLFPRRLLQWVAQHVSLRVRFVVTFLCLLYSGTLEGSHARSSQPWHVLTLVLMLVGYLGLCSIAVQTELVESVKNIETYHGGKE